MLVTWEKEEESQSWFGFGEEKVSMSSEKRRAHELTFQTETRMSVPAELAIKLWTRRRRQRWRLGASTASDCMEPICHSS